MPLFHQGIQIYHLNVIPEGFHHCFTSDARWEGCQGGEHGSFRHLECGEVFQISDEEFLGEDLEGVVENLVRLLRKT